MNRWSRHNWLINHFSDSYGETCQLAVSGSVELNRSYQPAGEVLQCQEWEWGFGTGRRRTQSGLPTPPDPGTPAAAETGTSTSLYIHAHTHTQKGMSPWASQLLRSSFTPLLMHDRRSIPDWGQCIIQHHILVIINALRREEAEYGAKFLTASCKTFK